MKKALLIAVGISLVFYGGGRLSAPEQMVSVGRHRLQMRLEGKGAPAVVIDAGITDGIEKLKPLQDRLAGHTQVLTYDRAGYGGSEPGPLPRDCGREADELKALLEAASVPGPYVLVGHSLGGLNVQVFAAKYPKDVAGIVLLDPPPLSFLLKKDYVELGAMAERMTSEWQGIADAGVGSADARKKRETDFYWMIASEHREMFGESARLAAEIPSFGNTPLLVIAAGMPNARFGAIAEEYQNYWIAQSLALSRKSTNGRFIIAERCTHYIYVDDPDLVVDNIISVVDLARGLK